MLRFVHKRRGSFPGIKPYIRSSPYEKETAFLTPAAVFQQWGLTETEIKPCIDHSLGPVQQTGLKQTKDRYFSWD